MELKINEWYSNKQLKVIISNYYLKVGIENKAKASDIKIFYKVKEKQMRINGIQTNGYLIISKI